MGPHRNTRRQITRHMAGGRRTPLCSAFGGFRRFRQIKMVRNG